MKRIAGFLAMLLCCLHATASSFPAPEIEARFARLSEDYISGYLAWRPMEGTALGLHEYDGRATDFGKPSLTAERNRLNKFAHDFAALDHSALRSDSSHQCRLLEASIQNQLFYFDDMKIYSTNPMTYAAALDVSFYVKRKGTIRQGDAPGKRSH